jgi:uncharacterized protein (DUF924 family)
MEPTDVLSFWFGPLDGHGLAQDAFAQRWWRKDAAFDAEIRTSFLATWDAIMRDQREAWLDTAHGRLAYVIVLDQFSRNMYRGDASSFDGDIRALDAAREGIDRRHDRELHGHERLFLYMPFMHSELLADQDRCVALLTQFRDESEGALRGTLEYNIGFAHQHRDIIARFGRFPHRNAVLERTSSAEEILFLQTPGSSF